MPPALCPGLLRKLINRLNKESSPEAREEMRVLKLILSEIEKQRTGKGQDSYVVKLQSKITIDLTDYSVHIHNELADALGEIDPPDLIERIRECPVAHCGNLFGLARLERRLATGTSRYGVRGTTGGLKRKVRPGQPQSTGNGKQRKSLAR